MRIALGIEYEGSHFWGYQHQAGKATVQNRLEKALSQIAGHPVTVLCAGRTDKGVHATGQVVHFDTEAVRPLQAWVLGTNAYLKKKVAVHWAKEVPDDFHARFSALSRQYQYVIANTKIKPVILENLVTWHSYPLDATLMHRAAQSLLGEHDFSAFRSSECGSLTPMRNIMEISVKRHEQFIILVVKGNAFLHRMVRIIAGNLMAVGDGRRPISFIEETLQAKKRAVGIETAPPNGLYLMQVEYPAHYTIPTFGESTLLALQKLVCIDA